MPLVNDLHLFYPGATNMSPLPPLTSPLSPPICMNVDVDVDVDAQSGSYVAVGLLDGRVQFFSARRGVKVMEFRAHAKKV